MTNKIAKLVSEKDIVFDGMFWIDKNGVKHRYVNPLLDEGFKILFGSEGNEDLLIDLLNKVLPEEVTYEKIPVQVTGYEIRSTME